jgi:hypothetical protein
MKTNSIKSLLAAVAALAVSTSAYADFNITFDSRPLSSEWSGPATWSAGPTGWAGAPGSMQSTPTAGGWQLGTTINFDWASGHQPDMQTIAAGGNGHVSFDFLVDGTSFNANAQWYQFNIAGNSDGGGWKQLALLGPSQNAGESDLRVTHFDFTFAQLGWTPTATWFQLNFGANSDNGNPIQYYIDNLQVSTVPEPSTFALAGLGAAALLIIRRRRA